MQGGRRQEPSGGGAKWSGGGVGFDQSLEIRGSCSFHCSVGKCKGLEFDAILDGEPVEGT